MNKESSSYRWVILLVAFLACFLTSFCQFQATAYAGDLMMKLNLTESQYTTIATAPMLIGVVLSLLAGGMGDKFGVKNVVFISLIITTVGALGRSFAGNYGMLLVCAVLMGMTGVVLNSNNPKLMMSWFSPSELSLAIGTVVASGNAGTVLAMLIGKSFSADVSKAFLFGGIAFVAETVLWILLIREKKIEMPEGAPAMPEVKIGDVLKCKEVWFAAIGAAFFMGVNMAASALLSPGLIGKGLSEGAASAVVIVFTLTALVGSILMPPVIGKSANTKITGAVLAVIAGITLFLGWKASGAAVRFILIAVSGLALGGLLPTLMSVPASLPEIGPAKMGVAGGVISTVMMAGAFILPSYVITAIAGGINDTAFLIAMICAFVIAAMFLILPNVSTSKKE